MITTSAVRAVVIAAMLACQLDHGPRAGVAVLADRGWRAHAEEPDLLLRSRRSHGRRRPAGRAAATLSRGQGAGWLRAHDLRRVLERASVVAGRRLEADRQPRRFHHRAVPVARRRGARARLSRLHAAHTSWPPRAVRPRRAGPAARAVADSRARPPRGAARA